VRYLIIGQNGMAKFLPYFRGGAVGGGVKTPYFIQILTQNAPNTLNTPSIHACIGTIHALFVPIKTLINAIHALFDAIKVLIDAVQVCIVAV